MRVRFDRDTCIGMFQCTAEWDAFEEDTDAGKADLAGSEEVEPASVFSSKASHSAVHWNIPMQVSRSNLTLIRVLRGAASKQ